MLSDLLVRLETDAHASGWPQARPPLLEVLKSLEQGGGLATAPAAEARQVCTRVAAVLMALFANPRVQLTHADYVRLAPHSVTISHILYLSGLGTPDPLLAQIVGRGSRASGGALTFADASDVRKFVLTCSLQSSYFEQLLNLAARDPQAFHAGLLRTYDMHLTVDPMVQAARNQLLASLHGLTEIVPHSRTLDSIHHVWALCSYATSPDRHQAKRHLNQMLRNWLNARGLLPRTLEPRGPAADRPTLLVVCEVMDSNHVMYRCYAPFLHQLRRRFRVVGLIAQEDLGPGGLDWCDDTLIFNGRGLPLKAVVDRIDQLRPDAVYYPCLGMRLWTILLCNLRLAPLQFATLGHPATTCSPEIDCMVVGRDMLGEPACFSEKVVLLRGPGNLYHLRPDDDVITPQVREHPDPVRVAVCANLQKLNPDFLALWRRIAARSPRRLALHVFPNTIGLRYQVTCQQVLASLGETPVTVYRRAPLATYRRHLQDCDLYGSPFPFGGENSALDAVLHGLPLVTMLGPEPHGRLDARVARLAGLPEWLITRSEVEYEEAALRLIGDDDLRCSLSQSLAPHRIRAHVEEEHTRYATDFAETVRWMYANQERILRADQRVWDPELEKTDQG